MSRIAAVALAALLAAAPAHGASLPDWLAAASRRAAPAGSGRIHALVLHHEQIVEVPAHGRTVITTRWALRLVTHEAANEAVATAGYARGTSEVKSLRAWTLAADGSVLRHWERKQAADVSDLEVGQLYTDLRHLSIEDDQIEPGQTFASEAVTEEEPLFAQWQWWFRDRHPCALSRLELHLPPGVDVQVRSAHLESVLAQHTPGVWSWQMSDQPALPLEPMTPSRPDLGPYLCVQAVPASGDRSPAGLMFGDWPAVSRWTADQAASQCVVTQPLAARAASLASGSPDSLAAIEAIARYVQGLNYVAIAFNTGRGWGYRPNTADAVLAAGYGDCKDKANLLCTLLRAAGYQAWLMPVYYGSRDRIDTAWASPRQFNHCIVAIRMPRSVSAPLFEAPHGARLMAFDPTDPFTMFGDLPEDEQGSSALLIDAARGGLVRLPVMPPDANRTERHLEGTLSSSGALSATVIERSNGQAAREERLLRRARSRSEYQGVLERWLPAQGGAVAIRSWAARDDTTGGAFELTIDYDSPTFARNVADKVLSFRGAILSPRVSWAPMDSARTTPIALPATCLVETLAVRLPEGFALDEKPEDLVVANDLGHLDASWRVEERVLVMRRRYQLEARTVGPERWADVLALVRAWRASNEATVVLARR